MRARDGVWTAVATVLLVVALGAAPPALAKKKLPGESHACGDAISHSFRLLNNLECSANGLTLTASNLTIDLGGHRLSGDNGGSDIGINVSSPSGGETIKNGVIANFGLGVLLDHTSGNTLSGLLIERSASTAITVNASTHNTFKRNLLVGTTNAALLLNARSDDNLATRNRFYGGSYAVALSGTSTPGDEVQHNVLSKNIVIGVSQTAFNISTAARGTKLLSNTVVGAGASAVGLSSGATGSLIQKNTFHGNGEGVFVTGAPSNTIDHNTITGSLGDGVNVSGTSTSVIITNNSVWANTSNGINIPDAGSTGGVIKGNKVLSNGANGIVSAAPTGVVSKNTANFNGYLNGITDPSKFGVSAATATNNAAKGNASGVSGNECNPASACHETVVPAPPLQGCGVVSQSITLHNPLECSSGDGLAPSHDGLTLNLGSFRVSGGTTTSDASVDAGTLNNITIKGGVLADSGYGAIFGGQGESMSGSIIANPSNDGVKATNISNSSFTRNTIVRGAGPSSAGFNAIPGTDDVYSGNTLVALDTGVSIFGGAQNENVRKNMVVLTRIGLLADDVGVNLPTGTVFASNTVLAARDNGMFVFTAQSSVVTNNVVRGSGRDPTGDGIRVDGSNTFAPHGSQNGTFAGNRVTASFHDGIVFLSSSTDNTLTGNTFSANDVDGAFSGLNTTGNVFKSNVMNENGNDGLEIDDPATATANKNIANTNGFIGTTTVASSGLGFNADGGTTGSGNVAKNNATAAQCQPTTLCA
jgi:parallel beta-helix repeat protein